MVSWSGQIRKKFPLHNWAADKGRVIGVARRGVTDSVGCAAAAVGGMVRGHHVGGCVPICCDGASWRGKKYYGHPTGGVCFAAPFELSALESNDPPPVDGLEPERHPAAQKTEFSQRLLFRKLEMSTHGGRSVVHF